MDRTASLFITAALCITSLYAEPSFNHSKVEKGSCEAIICSDNTLMRLDRELSYVYKKALS
jgi:uncharacterized protein